MSLKEALFKAAYLNTNEVILKAAEEKLGVRRNECAALCLKKSYQVWQCLVELLRLEWMIF